MMPRWVGKKRSVRYCGHLHSLLLHKWTGWYQRGWGLLPCMVEAPSPFGTNPSICAKGVSGGVHNIAHSFFSRPIGASLSPRTHQEKRAHRAPYEVTFQTGKQPFKFLLTLSPHGGNLAPLVPTCPFAQKE